MPPAKDQHVVQAFAAKRSHEPFREGVRQRRPDRGLDLLSRSRAWTRPRTAGSPAPVAAGADRASRPLVPDSSMVTAVTGTSAEPAATGL